MVVPLARYVYKSCLSNQSDHTFAILAHFLYYLGAMAKTSTKTKAVKTAPAKAPKAVKAQKVNKEEIAVIMTGGKQYIVSVGDTLKVERLANVNEGDTVIFDKVLLVDNGQDTTIGTPYITGAKVSATCQGEKKGTKITIVRYKAKSNRDRKVGHRQKYTEVHIDSLT